MPHRMITVGRIAAITLCLAVTAPQIVAQGTHGYGDGPADSTHHGMRGDRRFDLLKGITLSADQKAQIKAIHDRYRASMDSAHRANGQNKPDRMQMQQRMQAQWSELRNVLTADQQKIFDENMKQRAERMRAHQRG